MTDIDVNCPGLLTIRCRRRRTLKLTLKDQARAGATYAFTIYKDDDTVLYTESSTAQVPKITVESSLNVVLKDLDFMPATGMYRYDFVRTVTAEIKPVIEGSIIIMP